jgi:regulator of replication initiation timing
MRKLFNQVEKIRVDNASKLVSALNDNEKLNNTKFVTMQHNAMLRIESDVMRERLGRLYNSMQGLGDIKHLQDKYEFLQLETKKEQTEIRDHLNDVERKNLTSLECVSHQ